MDALGWIVLGGVAMRAIALVGMGALPLLARLVVEG